MQQSTASLPVAERVIAPRPLAGQRTCAGVRPYGGEPWLKCGAELTGDRAFHCESCDAEVERRQGLEELRVSNDGRMKLLQIAGLSQPFITGSKSLGSIRPLTPQHSDALAAVLRLTHWTPADGCRLSVRLCGDPGVGKSDIAEAAIAAIIGRSRPAAYVNARTLLLRLQGSFRDDAPESTDAMIQRFATIQFLALDDLGASKPTRFTGDALYEILERRTRNELPTIVVSNYVNLADLAQRLAPPDGDALDSIRPVDRIDELCPRSFELRGVSLRSTISREAAA
jgi:DNA replication protein DnaC